MAQIGLVEIKASQARKDTISTAKVRGLRDEWAELDIPQ
jgi:hypothetical protein